MKKERSVAWKVGIAVSVGMGIYLIFQLLLAFLVVKGMVAESNGMGLQVFSGGAAALLGGLWAAWMLPWGAVPSALTVPCGMGVLSAAAGLALYDGVAMTGDTLLRIGAMLAGGLLAGCIRAGSAGGRKRKKRAAQTRRHK